MVCTVIHSVYVWFVPVFIRSCVRLWHGIIQVRMRLAYFQKKRRLWRRREALRRCGERRAGGAGEERPRRCPLRGGLRPLPSAATLLPPVPPPQRAGALAAGRRTREALAASRRAPKNYCLPSLLVQSDTCV